MTRQAIIAIAMAMVCGSLFADNHDNDATSGASTSPAPEPAIEQSLGSSAYFATAGVTVRVVSDDETWSEDWGHSYRKVQIVDQNNSILMERVLPVDRAPDFGYTVLTPTGESEVAVLYAAFTLFVVDPATLTLSDPVKPLTSGEILGVDGGSGMLVQLSFRAGGAHLRGAVIHGGCFVLDLSDPGHPVRIAYTRNHNIEGMITQWPCAE